MVWRRPRLVTVQGIRALLLLPVVGVAASLTASCGTSEPPTASSSVAQAAQIERAATPAPGEAPPADVLPAPTPTAPAPGEQPAPTVGGAAPARPIVRAPAVAPPAAPIELADIASLALPMQVTYGCAVDLATSVSVLDAATGATAWSIDVPHVSSSAEMAVDAESISLVSRDYSTDASVMYSLSLADGTPQWMRPFTGSSTTLRQVDEAMLLVDQYFVYRVDPSSGAQLWQIGPQVIYADQRGRPLAVGDRIIMLNDSHMTVAVDLDTGFERWRRQLDDEFDSSFVPVVSATAPIVISALWPSQLFGLMTDSGEVAWAADFGAAYHHVGEPMVSDGVVALHLRPARFRDFDSLLVGLDETTGQELWRTTIADSRGEVRTRVVPGGMLGFQFGPNLDGAAVYDIRTGAEVVGALDLTIGAVQDVIVADFGAFLITQDYSDRNFGASLLQPVDNESPWTIDLTDEDAVFVDTDVLYIGGGRAGEAGFLRAYDPTTGVLLWEVEFDHPVASAPIRSGDDLVVLATDYPLFCD